MSPTRAKLAPYNAAGDLLAFPAVHHIWDAESRSSRVVDESEWRPIEPFAARLHVVGYERGQSAARIIWADETYRRYPMFMVDLVETLSTLLMLHGRTAGGWWIVQKRGRNYGIRTATQAEIAAAEARA